MSQKIIFFYALAVLAFFMVLLPFSVSADSSFSSGTYGSCQYNNCGISLTSNGTVQLNTIPSIGTSCTVASDTASVLTDSSTGYTLTLNDFDTTNSMSGSNGGTIAATASSSASPSTLSANTWGYRVDGALGFGAGPTSSVTNGSIPTTTFGYIPVSTATGDAIASSTSAADPAVVTTVWYGLCANVSLPSGTYSDSIVYTAVVN